MKKRKKKLWLVEDDRVTRKLLIQFLTINTDEFQIEEYEYAEKMLEKIRQEMHPPDLIIFDNILKGNLKGIDAVEQIRNIYKIPILIYSATPTIDLLSRCINLEMVRYLSKPINPIELDFHIKSLFKEYEVKNQLKTSISRYSALFNESIDMIFITNPEGRFVDINPSGINLLGYSNKEEILNIDIKKNFYVIPNDRERFKQEITAQGYVKDFQTKIRKKDNSIISIIESSTLVEDKDNKECLYFGIVRDITMQIENEQNLIKMNVEQININKKLKEAQAVLIQQEKMASIGGLAAGIAHEINNPLGFVVSNFRTLKNYMDTINKHLKLSKEKADDPGLKLKIEKSKKKIDFIMDDMEDLFKESSDGFDRIAIIVDNMRQFARVDSESTMSFINLNKSIQSTLVIAANSYRYIAEVKLQLSDIPEINCHVSKINQVLLNIIVNASQAIEEQKRKEKGSIEIRTYTEENLVCCLIKDDGPGISQNNIKKIFDPFFTTKVIGKGTGMGLSISYDIIVNKHKGELFVESGSKSGTTFIIKLHQNPDKIRKGETT